MPIRPTALAAAGLAVALLAGCTGAEPDPSTGPTSSEAPRDSGTPAAVEAVISVAGVDVDGMNITVSGYVQGILEDGGACSFSFAGPGGATVEAGTDGMADRSVTVCGGTQVPRDRFTKGTWKVTLNYTAVSGDVVHSDAAEVLVP
jgi:hypothetical protein